jgi:superfamily I DNA and RNA helicase
MSRFQVDDIVTLDGRPARVVWLRENANEIEAIDEYIVEFDDNQRRFALSSALDLKDIKHLK